MPITRAFFCINIRVVMEPPSWLSSQSAYTARCSVHEALLQLSQEFPVNGTSLILKRAPVEKGAHLQSPLKSTGNEHPAKSSSGAPTVSDFHSWALPYPFQIPRIGALLYFPLTDLPQREMLPFWGRPSYSLLKYLVCGTPRFLVGPLQSETPISRTLHIP